MNLDKKIFMPQIPQLAVIMFTDSMVEL